MLLREVVSPRYTVERAEWSAERSVERMDLAARPLDGVDAKLRQAKRHMYSFVDHYRSILWNEGLQVGLVPDQTAGQYLVEVRKFPSMDLQLSTIVGDALHCFRSALDHLIYEAGKQHVGKGSDRSMFPITSTPADFRRSSDVISDLPADKQTIVERWQPYNRPDHLLQLRYLNNIDKHRMPTAMLTEATFISEGQTPRGINCAVESVEWLGGGDRLRVGSHVARIAISGRFDEPRVELEGLFVPEVAFGDSGRPVIGTLLGIGSECVHIVREFETLLEPLPGPAFLHRGKRRQWPIFSSWPIPKDV